MFPACFQEQRTGHPINLYTWLHHDFILIYMIHTPSYSISEMRVLFFVFPFLFFLSLHQQNDEMYDILNDVEF